MQIDTSPSAVGSGVRDSRDFYATPYGLIKHIFNLIGDDAQLNSVLEERNLRVLDVGAGTGRWGEIARLAYPSALIAGIDKFFPSVFAPGAYNTWEHTDYLDVTSENEINNWKGGFWDLIVSNPPFKYAEEFIYKSWGFLADHGLMVFLLPLNFMCGQTRCAEMWPNVEPFMVMPCARRPDFGGTSGPKYEYAIWFWRKNHKPRGWWPVKPFQWEYDLELDPQAQRSRRKLK